jgi:hypothetical protein
MRHSRHSAIAPHSPQARGHLTPSEASANLLGSDTPGARINLICPTCHLPNGRVLCRDFDTRLRAWYAKSTRPTQPSHCLPTCVGRPHRRKKTQLANPSDQPVFAIPTNDNPHAESPHAAGQMGVGDHWARDQQPQRELSWNRRGDRPDDSWMGGGDVYWPPDHARDGVAGPSPPTDAGERYVAGNCLLEFEASAASRKGEALGVKTRFGFRFSRPELPEDAAYRDRSNRVLTELATRPYQPGMCPCPGPDHLDYSPDAEVGAPSVAPTWLMPGFWNLDSARAHRFHPPIIKAGRCHGMASGLRNRRSVSSASLTSHGASSFNSAAEGVNLLITLYRTSAFWWSTRRHLTSTAFFRCR